MVYIIPADYSTEAADKNHEGSDKGDAHNIVLNQPTDTEVESISANVDNTHENEIPTNETPTKPQAELHADNQNDCAVNNGGCDHTCNMGPSAEDQAFTVQCACNGGYYLDSNEKSCIGKFRFNSFLIIICFISNGKLVRLRHSNSS